MPSASLRYHAPAHRRPIALYLAVAFLLATLLPLVQPLLSHQPWMVFQQDDFYYYLQVARNLAHGLGSTANGLVPTNGYHPLWLLLLTGACRVSTDGLWLATFLALTGLVATAATFLLTIHLLGRLASLSLLASLPFATAVTVYALKLFFDGMEITLTIPLALGSTTLLAACFTPATSLKREERSAHRSPWSIGKDFCLGLLLALTVLSRLDAALLVLLLTVGMVLQKPVRKQLSLARIVALALGLSPILLYLLINRHVFGVLLPVSGMAKQLRTTHMPSAAVWQSVTGPHPLSGLKLLIPLATFVLLPADLLRRRSPSSCAPLAPTAVVALAALGLFPLVHLLVLSVLSDWRLWPWYLYPFRLALVSALVLLARIPSVRFLLFRPAYAIVLVCMGIVAALATRRDTTQTTAILAVADDLAHFAHTHPSGVYAMGDRSGLVEYLLPEPLIQTEGLTMEPAFLKLVRAETPLLVALRQLHVRYYVATIYLPPHTPIPNCVTVAEPFQAGPTSPHMRATLCGHPVARFNNGEFPTLVYDVSALPDSTQSPGS